MIVEGHGLHADAEVCPEDQHEGNVEERPKVLCMDCPAMLADGCHFVEVPSNGIDVEDELHPGELEVRGTNCSCFGHHRCDVEDQEDRELYRFDDISRARNDQAILIQDRCFSWIVESYAAVLIVVW